MKVIGIYKEILKRIDKIVIDKINAFCMKTNTDIKDIVLLEQQNMAETIYYIVRKDIHDGLETDKEVLEHSIPLCKIDYHLE